MSQENVEIVRAFYDRWDAQDLAPAFELLAPEVEWHTAPTSLSAGRTLYGVEAVLEHMDELLDAEDTEQAEATVERIVDIGEEVLVLEHEVYVGRASGVRTEARPGGIYTVANGRIVCVRGFMSHEEALEAAGLREQGV
jgi:ketosteroid isomerase-like protein